MGNLLISTLISGFPERPLPNLFPQYPLSSSNVNGLIVDGEWSSSLVDELFIPEDSRIIKQIPLCNNSNFDEFFWHYNKKGIYLVTSGCKLVQ